MGSEFVYVLEGVMDYQHQESVFRMEAGDSLLFDGEGLHGPARIIEAPIRFLSVFVTRERSEEHTSELQSRGHLVCRLLLEKKKMSRKAEEGQGRLSVEPRGDRDPTN